jgi:hypothetical protein
MIPEKRAHNFNDKAGRIYGDLTVIGLHGFRITKNGKKKSLWECKCICGKKVIIIAGNLSSGNTTNCGCNKAERLQFYVDTILRLPEGEASFNCVYSKYRYGARKRNLEFELSKEKFKELCIDNCFYCNKSPTTIEPANGYRNGEFIYNGIDRVNNDLGYVEGNCVTCCTICNYMKHALTQKDFLEHVKRIIENTERRKTNEKQSA